ncbi:MFS transporter [Serinibacter salmoneus]|uniref:Sugar phosphate permease n=1 Tax=Serinibacter salmoneus TaxID=556530 RepID=A0A2A9D4W9_9MICO|nr:MFS transporter [Serinibacter salmoneus]PFG20900.1 sugar phosphate permease [Serinibacter salmoneus]
MTAFADRAFQHARANPWIVWLTGCGIYFMAVLFRASLGVAGPEAVERLDLTAAQLGAFITLQLGMYALMQVPSGILLDRWGPRRVLLGAALVMGSAQIAFAFATSYPMALLARGMLGVGDSAVYLACLRLCAVWFPRQRYAVLAMLSGLFGMAGNLAATLPLTWALQDVGWVPTFAVSGGFAIAYSLLLLRPAVAAPYRSEGVDAAASPRGWRSPFQDLAQAWRGTDLGHGTRLGFWTHQATMGSGAVVSMVWGVPYLTQALGYTQDAAATMLMLLVLATLVSSFLIAPFAGRFPGRRMALALGFALGNVAAWALLLLWPGTPPTAAVIAAFAIFGCGGPASQIGFHLARDYSPSSRVSTATGLVNSGGFSAAMIGSVAVGWVLDALTGPGGATESDYRWSLGAMALITVVSTAGMVVSLLSLRGRTLRRQAAGQEVVIPVVAHWWDAPFTRHTRGPRED